MAVRPDALSYGDQEYSIAGDAVDARVDISRTASGYALRMRFARRRSTGPACAASTTRRCWSRSMPARSTSRGLEDEGLRSPYIEGDELDLGAWAHDALALAMPGQFLCRPECRGLCPVCGASLNDADPAEHEHADEAPPGPMAKLRELKFK